MSIFSIFLLLLFFVSFLYFSKKLKYWFFFQLLINIFISVFVEVGFFLNIDSLRIEYWQISSIFTFLASLFISSKQPWYYKNFNIYILTALFCLFLLIFFPVHERIVVGPNGINEEVIVGEASYKEPIVSKFSFFYFGFLFIQAFYVHFIYVSFDLKDYYNLIHKLAILVKFILCLVLLEFFIKLSFDDLYSDMLINIFGEGTSQSVSRTINDKNMLQGLTREGSHLVYSLYTGIVVLFVNSLISKKFVVNNFFILIALIELSLSMAFTSLLVLVMISLMYYIYFYNKNSLLANSKIFISTIKVLFYFGILVFVILFFGDIYYIDRFETSFDDFMNFWLFGKNDAFIVAGELSSTTARVYSVIDNISLLQYRPLFGVGFGTNVSHGSTALLLGEFGLLGLMSYIYFYFYSFPFSKRVGYSILVFIWIFGNIMVSKPSLFLRIDSFLIALCFGIIVNCDRLKINKVKSC
jgi:hypothetical protein